MMNIKVLLQIIAHNYYKALDTIGLVVSIHRCKCLRFNSFLSNFMQICHQDNQRNGEPVPGLTINLPRLQCQHTDESSLLVTVVLFVLLQESKHATCGMAYYQFILIFVMEV